VKPYAINLDEGFTPVKALEKMKEKKTNLVTKVSEPDVVSYVKSLDIFCATETFTSTLFGFSKHFENHHALPSLAIKLSARGRRSGGVAVFIDRSSMPFVTPIECSYDDN